MKKLYKKLSVVLLAFSVPFFSQAQISGVPALCKGSSAAFTDPNPSGSWSSSSAVATVDGSGNVYGAAAGSATISYSYTDVSGDHTDISLLTVNPVPDTAVISYTTNTVCQAASPITFNASVSGGTWSTANSAIATVDGSGDVTGVSGGTTTVSYTTSNGVCTSFASTTVYILPLPSPGTISGTTSVAVGGHTMLSDVAAGGVWHSANNYIATVDGFGNVAGVADGNTLISYTVTNSCGTAFTVADVIVGSCTPGTVISTFAGSHVPGYTGDGGAATAATIGSPFGVAADGAGNVYIADYFNNTVRKVSHAGIMTTIAGTGAAGYNGDNMPATAAQLNGPQGIAFDAFGNIYVADKFNERIRKIDPSGNITTVAGTGLHGGTDGNGYNNDGPATAANLDYPASIAIDCGGNMYIADWGSQTVRKIDLSGNIHNFAGTFAGGYNGDGIPATSAQLNSPSCVAADCFGNVFIADSWNNRVRKVTPDGIIATIAGNGTSGYSGDGGAGTSASLWVPNGITLDACGDLYICDWQNNVVRMLSADGNISTFAGQNADDWHGYDGDGHGADSAKMYLPASLAIDGMGNIYIADYGNNVIRAIGISSGSLPAERIYAAGTTQDMAICENAVAVPVNTQLSVADANSGIQETWSVTIQPHHGTLAGFNASAISRTGITTPQGLTYTPEANYTGTDSFTVVMNDGTTAASTTVNVNIIPQPVPGVITGSTNISDGQSILLTAAGGEANGVWTSSNTDVAIIDQAGKVTAITSGIVNVAYTVTNSCGSRSAAANIAIINDNVTGSKPMGVYPNPNNGTFQYEFISDKNEQLVLTVTDVAGRIVYTQKVNATTGSNVVTVTLPAGITNASMLTVHLASKTTKYPTTNITVTE